jgi:hypothetical protein
MPVRSRALVDSDATRMCELLIGPPDITVLGIVDEPGPTRSTWDGLLVL